MFSCHIRRVTGHPVKTLPLIVCLYMENVQIKENERIDDLQIKDYRIIQKTDGFCFGIDAVLLSDYARVKKKSKGIDLCSGTGIILPKNSS